MAVFKQNLLATNNLVGEPQALESGQDTKNDKSISSQDF